MHTNAKLESSVGQLCSSHGVDPLNQLIIATKAAPGRQKEILLLRTILCFTSDCKLSAVALFLSCRCCSPSPYPMEQTEEGSPRATICALSLGRLQASTDSAQGSIKRVVHAGLELLNGSGNCMMFIEIYCSLRVIDVQH